MKVSARYMVNISSIPAYSRSTGRLLHLGRHGHDDEAAARLAPHGVRVSRYVRGSSVPA